MTTLSYPQDARGKLVWLIRLRWIALIGQALGAIVGLRLGFLAREFFPLYATVVLGLAIWNVATTVIYSRLKSGVSNADLFLQFIADLGSLTVLIWISGGIYNPASALFLVHAVLATLLFRGSSLLIALAIICGSLAFLQWNPDVSHLTITSRVTRPAIFFSYSFVALFFAALTSRLSRKLHALETDVKTLTQRQERLDRLKIAGAVAAGFSHKFATPLSTLKLRLDRIQRKSPHEIQDDLQVAREALEECESILGTLTHKGLKADRLALEKISLAAAVGDWVREFQKDHSDVEIELANPLDLQIMIELPFWPVKQSFFDLLENAQEASQAPAVIRVELGSNEKQVLIGIENFGDAIPSLVLEKWGEPFVTTKSDGTGLGLYNAINLAQAMGGTIEATRPNPGTTRIELSLPLGIA